MEGKESQRQKGMWMKQEEVETSKRGNAGRRCKEAGGDG